LELDIFDRRTIANRLGDSTSALFQRYFPNIRQQVEALLREGIPQVDAQEAREREFLKVCYAFTFASDATRNRRTLQDETVLGLIALGGGIALSPHDVLASSEKLLGKGVLEDLGQIVGSLDRLKDKALLEKTEDRFTLSLSGRMKMEAARASLEATQRSIASDIIDEVCDALREPVSSAMRMHLEENAKNVLAEYFRMNGLELAHSFLVPGRPLLVYSQGTPRLLAIARNKVPAHIGDILSAAIGKALCSPSAEQASCFAGCSRAYIALRIMNVDPSLREFQRSRFSGKTFVLDTGFVLDAIIADLPVSETHRSLVERIVAAGARVVLSEEVLGEVARHLQIAPRTYDYFGPSLYGLGEEVARFRIRNALVLGYWYRARERGVGTRDDFMRYRANYYEPENPVGFFADVVRESLPGVESGRIEALLDVQVSKEELEKVVPIFFDIAARTPKGIERTEEENKEIAEADSRLMLGVIKHNAQPGKAPSSVLGNRAYLLTSSGRYVRVAEKLGMDAHVSTRPHIMVALMDLIGPTQVSERQFVALFENPLLQYSVESCWDGIKVLLDAGLDLRDSSISRLKYDVEKRLHTHIASLQKADAEAEKEDSSPEVGDAEHVELLTAAEQLGYRATSLLAKARAEGKLMAGEIAGLVAENQELREAVMRFGRKKKAWLKRMDIRRGGS